MKDQPSTTVQKSTIPEVLLGIEAVFVVVMLGSSAGLLGAMGLRATYNAVQKMTSMVVGEVKDKV